MSCVSDISLCLLIFLISPESLLPDTVPASSCPPDVLDGIGVRESQITLRIGAEVDPGVQPTRAFCRISKANSKESAQKRLALGEDIEGPGGLHGDPESQLSQLGDDELAAAGIDVFHPGHIGPASLRAAIPAHWTKALAEMKKFCVIFCRAGRTPAG